jgi:hypothetical protein
MYHNNTWAYNPTTVETDSSSGPDLSNHPFFILAMDGSPQWTTTLVQHERYTAAEVVAARAAKLGIPLWGIIPGGRNGSLVFLSYDPKTQVEVDLMMTTGNPKHTASYAERIKWTTLEHRDKLHN